MNEEMAISLLKAYVDLYRKVDIDRRYLTKQGLECIETVLNLVEKQKDLIEKQNEKIEKLKKPKYLYKAETNEIKTLCNDFISKDKVINELKNLEDFYTIDSQYYSNLEFHYVLRSYISQLKKVIKDLLEEN